MQIVEDVIIERLLQLGTFEGPEQAKRVFTVTASALRDLLTEDEAAWLGEVIGPLRLRRHRRQVESPSADALYRRVAFYGGVSASIAREHAQAVCRALAESLPYAARRLRKTLPPLAELFAPPDPMLFPVLPRWHLGHSGYEHALAGGGPGGARPVHDARPFEPEGQGPEARRPAVRGDLPLAAEPLQRSGTGSAQRSGGPPAG